MNYVAEFNPHLVCFVRNQKFAVLLTWYKPGILIHALHFQKISFIRIIFIYLSKTGLRLRYIHTHMIHTPK